MLSIGLDVDGPLVFDNGRMHGFFAYMRNISLVCSYEKYVLTGRWREAVPGLDRPALTETWTRYVAARNLRDLPTPGAATALASLTDMERVIATARTGSEQTATVGFLEQHYGSFHGFHFELDCKIKIAQRFDFFVDDNVGIADDVAKFGTNGTKVILFPTPGWRRTRVHPKVIVLEAERDIAPDMPIEKLPAICEKAWAEICTIIHSAAVLA
jgi:hypothetical protein